MGQRTNVIVQETMPIEEYNQEEGGWDIVATVRKVFLYHNQWGYGDGLLKDAMAYILSLAESGRQNQYDREDFSLQAPKNLYKAWLVNPEYADEPARLSVLENTPINTVQDIQDIIWNYCDNNNGAILLKINRSKYGYIESGEFCLFKGDEECEEPEVAFSRVISLSEYVRMWKREDADGTIIHQCSPHIVSAFRSLCRYYNIKAGRLGTRPAPEKGGKTYQQMIKELEQEQPKTLKIKAQY